jgi:hypothetical protein
MSTVIQFRCRNATHLAAPSRHGVGGIVFRHGTAAYCDGIGVDDRHQWVATGGVPLESLIGRSNDETTVWEDAGEHAAARAGYVSDAVGDPRPLQSAP